MAGLLAAVVGERCDADERCDLPSTECSELGQFDDKGSRDTGTDAGDVPRRLRISALVASAAIAVSMQRSSLTTRRSSTFTRARISRRTMEVACSSRFFSATIIAMS